MSVDAEQGAKEQDAKIAEVWDVLLGLASALLDEEGEFPDTDAGHALERLLSGGLHVGQRVLVFCWGTGRTFPEGMNVSTGTILKHGQTEWAWLVKLDRPFGEHEVVNLPALNMRALQPEEEPLAGGPRERASDLAEK